MSDSHAIVTTNDVIEIIIMAVVIWIVYQAIVSALTGGPK